MCGIAGFIDARPNRTASPEQMRSEVARMADSMTHRGPDDSGAWVDPLSGVALGFRRLAILDLSPTGHQPMHSPSGRYAIVFNGEIYNYRELREELEAEDGSAFRGSSDTEVLLAAIDRWGIRAAVERCAGMFGLAVWDRRRWELHLCRDRIGEKPLYYAEMGPALLFASEIQAFRAHHAFSRQIDRDALALYFRHNYIPAPHSIYRGVRKLLPGTILTVSLRDSGGVRLSRPVPYWSARELAKKARNDPIAATDQEAVDHLDKLLRRTVRREMIADVPLGAFLSGGIDSSLVVALMQAQSTRPVRTFTIGFSDPKSDEAPFAKAVAEHLGTDHTELYVTLEQLLAVIPLLPGMYGEPFADASQIPTYLVAQLARRHVTVCLSGDGGDELFCGYRRYLAGQAKWRRAAWLPKPARTALGRWLCTVATSGWSPHQGLARKLHRKGRFLAAGTPTAGYGQLVSLWADPTECVLGATEPLTAFTDPHRAVDTRGFLRSALSADVLSYLPDDLLAKVDRAAMAVSLESRAPLVDHRIVEFSFRLPQHLLMREGKGKWLLRNLLYRYVPKRLVERPKKGFSPPLGAWLRGPLRDWAEALISPSRLRSEGFLNPQPIRRLWKEHLEGTFNWSVQLWVVLMFQAWHEQEAGRIAAPRRVA